MYPLLGGGMIAPVARCAVPFFFVVSGFYLYSGDKLKLKLKIKANIKKWFALWVFYTLILALVVFVLKLLYDDSPSWTLHDTFSLIRSGVCKSLDLITINGKIFGTSTMWFLYAGFISFCFFFIIREHMNKPITTILIGMLLLIGCSVNYVFGKIVVDRSISVAIPFMYAGYVIRQYKNLCLSLKNSNILLIITLFLITLYVEVLINNQLHKNVEVFFSTIPLTIFSFIYLVKNPNLIGLNIKIPIKVAMDVYIWHRLVYVLLFGVIGLNIVNQFAAIIVFIVIMFIAAMVRTKFYSVAK